jgi:hypothetical protein
VIGAVLVLLGIFIVGPIGLFITGAAWAAVNGWLASEDADLRASSEVPATE